MQATNLLLLFLATLLVNVNSAATEEFPQTSDLRSLLDKNDGKRGGLSSLNDDSMGGLVENEDRGFTSSVTESVASKIKGLWKSTGLRNKFGRSGKNAYLVATVERMPIVKKLETTIERNPKFIDKLSKNPESIKKLARDPEVAKVTTMLKKNDVKVTQDSIKQLRAAASNDPAKLSTLDVIDRVAEMGTVAVSGAIALLLLAASGWALSMVVPYILLKQK
ncbi:Avr1b-1 avirulence-like protein [Phytophthora cinnamomi]|uniref:Avr1b-1 avirulence-like protein n=1 Tax=Phytophthora cinnamomi TaxID=4785 RepID=UPI002A2C3197|nr:Avr1b-1 avirulence-like protein [Phytophthora cinnamomi]KAJ8524269.1 hypothetical protein ON010_g16849 [Phytophthora cinnamomi]